MDSTIALLKERARKNRSDLDRFPAQFMAQLFSDLHKGDIDRYEKDWLDKGDRFLDTLDSSWDAPIDKEFSTLSWFPEKGRWTCLGTSGQNMPLTLPFQFAWLRITYNEGEMSSIPRGTFRDVRDVLIQPLLGEGGTPADQQALQESFVLFVVIDGPDYTVPDIAAVGPSMPKSASNGDSDELGLVKTVFHDLNRTVSEEGFSAQHIRQKLNNLLYLGDTDRWRETFEHALDSREAIRKQFANRLRGRMETLMNALDATVTAHPDAVAADAFADLPDDQQLKAAREAATLLVFRILFLAEMESRRLLYTGNSPTNDAILSEYAADIKRAEDRQESTSRNMLQRLVHLVRAVRTNDPITDDVKLAGGSIFSNRPNEQFEAYPAVWLDALESVMDNGGLSNDLRIQWNRALADTCELVTGFVDDEVQLTKTRAGLGASEHTHRIFGDVYEQLLRFTPERDDERIRLVIDDEERNKVAAHYTPADLVEEVVRPTLGHLFEQHWNDCDHDAAAYEERLMKLRIVDPAMGSAHFLTVAALELAREVAYVHMNGTPRHFDWHEPLEHDNPIGYDPDEEGYPGDADDTLAQPTYHGTGDAQTFNEKVADILPDLVQRNIYGVDIKPMAAELGKLALWLFTMSVQDHSDAPDASDAPSLAEDLVYLDANIKSGDSLVGMLRSDVHDTIENTLRASSSAVDTKHTLFATAEQVDSVADKMKRAETLIAALREGADVLSDEDRQALEDALGEPLDLDAQSGSYARKERLDHAVRAYLSDLRWVFDLTLAIHYIGYTSGSREGKAGQLYKALFDKAPAGKDTNDLKEPIEEALGTLFDAPEGDAARTYQTNVQNWIAARPDLTPFHWELEYPDAFAHDGFDAVVANPPFIGDRRLKSRLDSADLVNFLADYYIPSDGKSEYAGFFFWRYDHVANDRAVVSSLATNSIAQASNRRYVTKPLTSGPNPPFHLYRAMPNRDWPSDAGVHFAIAYMSRIRPLKAYVVRPDFDASPVRERSFEVMHNRGVSSYFDEYPDYDLRVLIAAGKTVFTGMFLRGNFSLHRKPGDSLSEAIKYVPEEERDALAAHLNLADVQNSVSISPSNVIIDFFEPLKKQGLENAEASKQKSWLEENYPNLLDQLQSRSPHDPERPSIYEERNALDASSDNTPHKEKWWLFGRPRRKLRREWKDESSLTLFPGSTKVWSPFHLGKEFSFQYVSESIRICPTHALFVAPRFNLSHFAITSCSLFEAFTRRQSSTIREGLRFTHTNVFPYFPWPWKPKVEDGTLTIGSPPAGMKASLETAAQNLLDLRTDILEHSEAHGLTRAQVGGPTDLYNLYDSNPNGDTARDGADNASVERLRQAHVDLLNAVLHAYGWDDLAAQCTRTDWTFDRPWLDRTERFVPPEPIRAKLFERIDALNSERYEQECALMTDLIIDNLPLDGLNKTGFREKAPFSEMSIDADLFEELMIKEQATPNPRVKKEGYNWKRL